MISVGVDVSKGKSTVCVMKPYGEIVLKPFEVQHTESELSELEKMLRKLDGEVRLVMEATGVYHLPLLTYFLERGYFVSVINPYAMRKYAKDNSIRGAKTDKLDSIVIANYGIEKWYKLQNYDKDEAIYAELKLLGRRYRFYMELHIKALQELTHMLDYTMPGLKTKFNSWDEKNNKDKLSDFVERFWHYDLIIGMSRDDFVVAYCEWLKKRNTKRANQKLKKYMNWHLMVFLRYLQVLHLQKC
ncbi:IS110 family transposase [Pseudobutyrivibrio xylanivorans]|uniref:IS110 family transposase n=1 Tax=Pseudobutyrivibrio xylanivorans TaxID=185007 RepID=UPI002ED06496